MESGLDHGDEVERPVQLAVAAPVETHPLDLSRAGRDRRDARESRQGVRRSEAADIAYLGDEPSGRDRPSPRKPQKRVAAHEGTDATRQGLDLLIETREAQEETAGELGLDPADTAQEPADRRPMAGGNEVRDRPAVARRKSEQMSVQSISCTI
jgi:hypothetical protein